MLLKIDDPVVAHEYLKAGLLVNRSGVNWHPDYKEMPATHPTFTYLMPCAYISIEE